MDNNKDIKNISDMTQDEIKEEQARILSSRGFTQDEINALIY